ncbi:Asp-tRNA(Asn)/Glu-tRNA(Gln) amidotransferase subunit GatA [Candidatus Peregrinibacteria bacterium]|nr:MAG: Asp-tRNA(Asn)/Glu-tRNA(Gln) amidotransferase subunit GatA [Candidatus Peregrinibacteria bacterium]
MTISKLISDLRNRRKTATEITESYLQKIETSPLNAYISVNKEEALQKAKELDKSGDFSHPLAGIPVGIKDSICTKGVRTTAGSKVLEYFVPPYSATCWEKLEEAGAILLGKTNCDEFTMGSSTEGSAFGPTKNPHDHTRVPGGSSGGSAAAVAGDECVFSLGTDTGGSIRQPANFCGCVGLKVTYGRVSRSGVISYASSFDTIGPLTKTVEDAAYVLEIIAGKDKKDSTTPNISVPKYTEMLKHDISGKIIGLPKEFLEVNGIGENVRKETEKAAKILEQRGAKIREISLPLTEYAIPTYYLLVKAEASTNLAKYDGVRFGSSSGSEDLTDLYQKTRGTFFGDEPKRAIMMGTFTLSSGYVDAYYKKAAAVRRKIAEEYARVLEEVDALIAPVSPFPPFSLGEKIDDPLQMYLADIFTVTANLAGIPSLAVPTGKQNGLPTGVQILGKQFDEAGILQLGWHLESACKEEK